MPRFRGGRTGSRMREHQSSVKDVSGSKSKASEGASQSVPRGVSPPQPPPSSSSSSLPTEEGSNGSLGSSINYEDSDGPDPQNKGIELDEKGEQIVSIKNSLPYRGLMLLLFESPSGFSLHTFAGVHCYLPDSEDNIWAEFGDPLRASLIVYPKEFISFENKSVAITDIGVEKRLANLISKWHHPGMNLCVGKPEYKRIIEKALKIDCMCCQTVMEIMWGIQQQLHTLVRQEKTKLAKEDRLPTSKGLIKFLSKYGFDVKPEMVNEKIFLAACDLFRCDNDDDKKNLGLLRDAGLSITEISGIACEDWNILKLATAVKVICFPNEELTDFHEVLAKDVVLKLKGDERKYKHNPIKDSWLSASEAAVSNHHTRIAKKKLLASLVQKAEKAYEAEQAVVCEKGNLQGVSEQIAQDHVTSMSNPTTQGMPYENSGEGAPHKRPKY